MLKYLKMLLTIFEIHLKRKMPEVSKTTYLGGPLRSMTVTAGQTHFLVSSGITRTE